MHKRSLLASTFLLLAAVACGGGGDGPSTGTGTSTTASVTPSTQPSVTTPPASTTPTAPQQTLANASGPCLVIRGEDGRVVENMRIGPCGGNAIEVWNSQNVTLRNVTIADATGAGVYIEGSTTVQVRESKISDTIAGITAVNARNVAVQCNTIEDPRGPVPRGQFVQFNKVNGDANVISCNRGTNNPGRGQPEDTINIYQSNGIAGKPISVLYNLIKGGGPSVSGGGILLGDDGGTYQLAKGNVLVDPGQYGVAVASGEHHAIQDNTIFARQQGFTNVGIYVWNQYAPRCDDVTVSGNSVNYRNKAGVSNPFWNGGNCTTVNLVSNDFAAQINETIATRPPPAQCTCQTEGWR